MEVVVNSKPMTSASNSIDDYGVLSPNHFIFDQGSNNIPIINDHPVNFVLNQKWRLVQTVANQFWTRRTPEYFLTLTKRQKWSSRSKNLEVGDLVFLYDKNVRRSNWNLSWVI